jgi:hypothetical protein
MNTQDLRIVEVCTTGYEEENFLLLTNLSDNQIYSVIYPLVKEERANESGDVLYDNEAMTEILQGKYPNDIVIMYSKDSVDYIEF